MALPRALRPGMQEENYGDVWYYECGQDGHLYKVYPLRPWPYRVYPLNAWETGFLEGLEHSRQDSSPTRGRQRPKLRRLDDVKGEPVAVEAGDGQPVIMAAGGGKGNGGGKGEGKGKASDKGKGKDYDTGFSSSSDDTGKSSRCRRLTEVLAVMRVLNTI